MNRTTKIAESLSFYNRKSIDRTLSGSQFGNEHIQNYLILKGEENKTSFTVGQNSIGSIFHFAMETESNNMFTPEQCESEIAVSRLLPNGWNITGTIDRVDHDTKTIHDYKLTKKYIKAFLKREPEHGYRLQANIYKWCLNNDYRMVLDLFYKDSNEAKNEVAYEEFEIDDIHNIEEIAIQTTNELQVYLDSNALPPKCGDVWLRKLTPKGPLVATRCMTYCGVSDACPHYSDSKSINDSANSLAQGW